MTYLKFTHKIAALVLGSVLLSACVKDDDNMRPEFDSALNVSVAIPGADSYAISLDKSIVQGNALKFSEETGYFLTYSGNRDFDLSLVGNAQPLFSTKIALEREKYQSLFLTRENGAITYLLTSDDMSRPPAGKAKVRFVQLSDNAGSLTLGVKGRTDLTTQNFKTASEFIVVDPGVVDLQVKSGVQILAEKNITLESGLIYTVWSRGNIDGSGGLPLGINVTAIN